MSHIKIVALRSLLVALILIAPIVASPGIARSSGCRAQEQNPCSIYDSIDENGDGGTEVTTGNFSWDDSEPTGTNICTEVTVTVY